MLFLRQWREHRGLSLEQLAEQIETTRLTLHNYELAARKNKILSYALLMAYAQALNVTTEQLRALPKRSHHKR